MNFQWAKRGAVCAKANRAVVALVALVALIPTAMSAQPTRSALSDDLSRLPITEMPAQPDTGNTVAIFLTGDGGWATLDKQVVAEMRAHGVAVVGLNTRPYLSKKKTSDEIANDLTRISRHYLAAWNRPRLAIVGYSRGADLMPFGVAGMPADLRNRIVLLGLLGLGTRAGFEFHFEDIFLAVKRPTDQLTLPVLNQLEGLKMLCVFGSDEKESGCRNAAPGLITRKVELPGGHHWDNDYKLVGDLVVEELRPTPVRSPAQH
jgi:type IV secretory pathway VirJ component